MKNSPKKPGQDHLSTTPARTDKRDPSQPPARRDQPQGYQDQDLNKRGQEPRREDELPLKKDRQPVAKSTQRDEPREKGQSTGANKSTNVNKKAQTIDVDASDEEYLREDEDIDDVDYGDDDSDVDDDEK